MTDKENTLIIGADSLIGNGLINYLISKGMNVYGTSRREKELENNIIFFKIGDSINKLNLHKYSSCVFCAGITSINYCEDNEKVAFDINVSQTIKIIKACIEKGIYTIFLSSDLVFSGEKKNPSIHEKTKPFTKSGLFKKNVEDYMLDLDSNLVCILRLTKVISANTPIIKKWSDAKESNSKIIAFTDQFISPINIENVCKSLFNLINEKHPGLFHLGGDNTMSYFEFAKSYFKEDKIALNLIKPIKSKSKIKRISSLQTFLPKKN